MGEFHRGFNKLTKRLLSWFDAHARDLPWRVGPAARARGLHPDPYRVWLSEIMLQQTTIPHAARYFLEFTRRWPRVEALAAAPEDEVMAAWAGLGYYARARNLIKCAREVAACGRFPDTVDGLRELPGIGPYTAGAIAAIAFDVPAAAVDGNVERVFARLMALETPWPEAKQTIRETVAGLVPAGRPGDFAEALMDLGATVCTPKRPNCLICPLRELCAAHAQGTAERYPVKPKRGVKPTRAGHAFLLVHESEMLVERRPERGLLGGMLGLPGNDWLASGQAGEPAFPAPADWAEVGDVRHVFTHFELTLKVWRADIAGTRPDGLWHPVARAGDLPSVFAKAVRLAAGPGGEAK